MATSRMSSTKPIRVTMLSILVCAFLTTTSADNKVSDVIMVTDRGWNAAPDSTKEPLLTEGAITPTASAASLRGTLGATAPSRHRAHHLLLTVPYNFFHGIFHGRLANSNLQQAKLLMFIMIAGVVILAVPGAQAQPGGGHGHRPALRRDPPAWSPERESSYPFRFWTQDLLAWAILATDIGPAQQTAATILQLCGSARDLARNLTYQEMTQG